MKWNVGKGLGVIGPRWPNHSLGGIALWRRAVGFTAQLWRGDERAPDAGSRSVARREKGTRLASGACSRRGCFCSFPLAALAVLATAAAQTVTTFISNTGKTRGGVSNQIRATAFTTGTGTYTLSSVAIVVSTPTGGSNPIPVVQIYGDTGGNPGTLVATLTNPATVVYDALNIYTAPPNTTLAASTTYWLVTSNSAATNGLEFRVNVVANTNVDSGTAAGWSIGNARFKDDISAASWSNSNNRIQFQIRGTEQTAPTNNAPTVANAIPDQTATAATGFSYQFPANTFNDTDTGQTLSYMATKADGMALPTWLGFIAGTRTFAGTPAASDVGTVSVKVTASDGNGGSVSDEFDITVEAGPLAHCDTTDTNEIFCATMVVAIDGSQYGFADGNYGSLSPDDFTHNSAFHDVLYLFYWSYPAFTDGWFLGLMVSDVVSFLPRHFTERGNVHRGRGEQPGEVRSASVAPALHLRFRPHG